MKKSLLCLLLCLVLLLSACQTVSISELTSRPGERLFWDDFSETTRNWPQVSGPNGNLGISDGRYQIQVLSAQFLVLAASRQSFKDVRVEVVGMHLAGSRQNSLGLACRSRDMNNYYFFMISNDGYYALGKIKDGNVTLLGQEMMAYDANILQGDSPNHLRLDCIGGRLTGSINGEAIASAQDADFASGKVGLVAGTLDISGAAVAFDDFVVYKP